MNTLVSNSMAEKWSGANSEQTQPTLFPSTSGSVVPLVSRYFTTAGKSPLDLVQWEKRNCRITDPQGNDIFYQEGVEAPSFWSQMATDVVASKYFHGAVSSSSRESSIGALISRVVRTIANWGDESGYFRGEEECESFIDELTHILLHQHASFNSPVWFNVGIEPRPQCSACFIVPTTDTLESLLELQQIEGKLFKYGSGTGTNLSSIRSSRERLSGGGVPSGPVSFMRAFDAWAGVIKSGGKTRRAAKMQILNIDHPDILEFIDCKPQEEKKAWALIEAGYDASFFATGGAYDSVAFQNVNLSVRVTDDFMTAAQHKRTYATRRVTDGAVCEELDAAEVLLRLSKSTHLCGDPGVQFDTTINHWHTCKNSGRINSSNPCSEFMHLDNSACNLASINLLKYLAADGSFDLEGFKHTVQLLCTAQDILIDNSSYPTDKIQECVSDFRQLGLGFTNLGALLMSLGLPYDSVEGREWATFISSTMTGEAYKTSAVLAERLGPFAGFETNRAPMLEVMHMHQQAANSFPFRSLPSHLVSYARDVWRDVCNLGTEFGFRNSQTTVIAPTGTISFMMDCDTTGVEPDIALIKFKKLSDGGMLRIVNNSVERALKALNYRATDINAILSAVAEGELLENCAALRKEHLPVFDCAMRSPGSSRCVGKSGHLKMMASIQPFISGAISKTVNLPTDVTVEEIYETYMEAWKLDLKAVALYRDGSKRTQPLGTSEQTAPTAEPSPISPPRRRLPEERHAITHRFSVAGHEGYLTVGLYDDGSPGEIFLLVAKEGSTLSGIMDAFATSVSLALQHGVPLLTLVKKFAHMRFEPAGFTENKDIPLAKSIIDYVFQWLGLKFLSNEERLAIGLSHKSAIGMEQFRGLSNRNGQFESGAKHRSKSDQISISVEVDSAENMEDSPPCVVCGSSLMVRQASCYVCLNCGTQGGCS